MKVRAVARAGRVDVAARVRIYAKEDTLVLLAAADARAPTWSELARFTPPVGGEQDLLATYVLPAGDLQAFRAVLTWGAWSIGCGPYDDIDDLAFAVGPAP